MTLGGPALEYRRLRAPRDDQSVVVDPPYSQVASTLAGNAALRADYHYDVSGRSLKQLGDDARRELVTAAFQFTSQYRNVDWSLDRPRLLLAGHQPELFHPGVWCKNFALSALAQQHDAVAVNLIVDSDTIKRTSVRVPAGSVAAPRTQNVSFDAPGEQVPFEERAPIDWSQLESFGQRVAEQIRPLVKSPVIESWWPRVVGCVRRWGRLGAGLATSRHLLEADWGAKTLEIPQSLICGLPSFCWFAAHLLEQSARLHQVYNSAVREFRRVNHIRSSNHPVPDLAVDGPWREAPFWVWTSAEPQRRRLFVRCTGSEIELTDRKGWQASLPAKSGTEQLAQAVAELARQGIKLRSRALLTTLFARLVLGDLFLHGIGGAKYDELTDLIIRRFCDIEPPRYMFLSATLLLPVEHERVSAEDLRSVEQRLRELRFHPERYLRANSLTGEARHSAESLMAEKRHWIATPQTRQNARVRCQAIRGANEGLQPFVDPQRVVLAEQRTRLAEALRGESILSSREYAFCLYPESALRPFMQRVCEGAYS